MNKKDLSERDICTKFITPAIVKSGWDKHKQIRAEKTFIDGKLIVRGKRIIRGEKKERNLFQTKSSNYSQERFNGLDSLSYLEAMAYKWG